jgi:hypothetical protein
VLGWLAFLFRLETAGGESANSPTLSAAVPNWGVGDRIYLGARTLQWLAVETTMATSLPYP